MTFDVAADAYGRFMGRFSSPLAVEFLEDLVGPQQGDRVLDVGCGPGALTTVLVGRLGASHVWAIDPSEPFVGSLSERMPTVDVRLGSAEDLPFEDDSFDLALAQLVVHFMRDPAAGLREMARVTRPGGRDGGVRLGPRRRPRTADAVVAGRGRGPPGCPGTSRGSPAPARVTSSPCSSPPGWVDVEPSSLTVRVGFDSFEDWWEPYTYGVGPAGAVRRRAGRRTTSRAARRVRPADATRVLSRSMRWRGARVAPSPHD